jgi:apolipoprotein N-acyltransferase
MPIDTITMVEATAAPAVNVARLPQCSTGPAPLAGPVLVGAARYLGAGLSGALIALPWLQEQFFPATWIGIATLLYLSLGKPAHFAFRFGLLTGVAAAATGFYWLPAVAAYQLNVSLATGVMVALCAITWDAFRFGIFTWGIARWKPGVLGIPAVWVALEWIWPHVFPWRLGHTQSGWLPLCQIAEATGDYGVSFLVVWGAACCASLLRAGAPSATVQDRRNAISHIVLFALALAGCLVWGGWRIATIERETARRARLRIALVQPGIVDDVRTCLQEQSRRAAQQSDLIVWGESSIGDFADDLDNFRSPELVAARARSPGGDQRPCPGLGCPLLCGGGSFAPGCGSTGPFHNTAYLIDAGGDIIGRYHKRVLMPWGEYAAGQQWIPGLRRLLGSQDPYIPGDSATPLRLPDGAWLGVLICYEDLSAGAAREAVLEGAQLLVNLNNLSSFGRTPALAQHQQTARFRAIENRRALVRCGITGLTSLISPTGRVEAQAAPYAAETLRVTAPLLDAQSLYTRWGDVFAMGCLAAIVGVCGRRQCAHPWRFSRFLYHI